MVDNYLEASKDVQHCKSEGPDIDEMLTRYSSGLRWDREQRRRLRQRVTTRFSSGHIRHVAYRPFVKQNLYANYTFSQAPGQTRDIFPFPDTENRAICVSGVGSTKPFSALVVDTMPDLGLISNGQCFPRYEYRHRNDPQHKLWNDAVDLERIDNISDTSLRAFRIRYSDNTITKDAIFDYVYGILHAPAYRERFAKDLAKELPRIPLADDFRTFSEAGLQLA